MKPIDLRPCALQGWNQEERGTFRKIRIEDNRADVLTKPLDSLHLTGLSKKLELEAD